MDLKILFDKEDLLILSKILYFFKINVFGETKRRVYFSKDSSFLKLKYFWMKLLKKSPQQSSWYFLICSWYKSVKLGLQKPSILYIVEYTILSQLV